MKNTMTKPLEKSMKKQMSVAKEVKIAHTIDARICCPDNIMQSKRGLNFVKVGEILEIIACCEDVKYYMPIWVKKMGHELVRVFECDNHYKIWIRKNEINIPRME